MTTVISYEFAFESAHRLPKTPPGHKCHNIHGHSYKAEVSIEGPVDPEMGWIMDFSDLREAFAPLRAVLDHRYLNEVEGLQNPTSENLARWILERLEPRLPKGVEVYSVRVSETPYSSATVCR